MTKVCTGCGAEKPLESYYKDSRGKHGRRSRCKTCHNEESARNAPNKKLDPVKALARRKRWEDKNPDWRRAYENAYRKTSEVYKETRRQWLANNPDKTSAYANKRRALKSEAEGSHTPEQWMELCASFDNVCLACGEFKPLERDHILPLSKGGPDDISNIQPLCKSCNCKKATRHIDYRSTA